MFTIHSAFSGFSVNDTEKAQEFYARIPGVKAERTPMGLQLHLPGGSMVFAYQKDDHQAATFTILNFVVADIDEAVDALTESGIHFERYENIPADEKGIVRGRAAGRGPDIAWFKDPAGNILSVLQDA